MKLSKIQLAFFELVRAGLWRKDTRLSQFDNIDYATILQLAEEQTVVGLVTAGLEQVSDVKVPQEWVLQFIGETLQIEQQNKNMNIFVAKVMEKLRGKDVYAILVKGQGIAQCYEKPLWRVSGDVDLLLSPDNYEKAKKVLLPLADKIEREFMPLKHLGMTMKNGYVVELHGVLHSRLSTRVDKVIDEAQRDVFYGGNVRSWINGNTSIFLPSPDNDVIFVFTHILKHFYIEGVGLRQICDWCRLLWAYRDGLNHQKLGARIRRAGLMSEWKAFAALAVQYLGMPVEAMPLYNEFDKHNNELNRKAERIMNFVLESGNFGHNRYVANGRLRDIIQKSKDFVRYALVFPWDSLKFYFHYVGDGIRIAMNK